MLQSTVTDLASLLYDLMCVLQQEADIQRHRQRLINQGHIENIAAGAFGPRRQQTLEQSAQTFEVPVGNAVIPLFIGMNGFHKPQNEGF